MYSDNILKKPSAVQLQTLSTSTASHAGTDAKTGVVPLMMRPHTSFLAGMAHSLDVMQSSRLQEVGPLKNPAYFGSGMSLGNRRYMVEQQRWKKLSSVLVLTQLDQKYLQR